MLIGHSLADGAGLLLAVDPRVCEIMHREERELVGVSFETLTHPDDRARNVAALAKLAAGDGPLTLRKRYIRPDGSAMWSSVQVSRLRGSDGDRLIGTIRLIGPQNPERGPEGRWRAAMRLQRFMRQRRGELGIELTGDHGWAVLLRIYLAEAEGRVADVQAIADAVDIRASLVGRWLAVLEQKALVERAPWAGAAPQLTADGLRKVEHLLDSVADQEPTPFD